MAKKKKKLYKIKPKTNSNKTHSQIRSMQDKVNEYKLNAEMDQRLRLPYT